MYKICESSTVTYFVGRLLEISTHYSHNLTWLKPGSHGFDPAVLHSCEMSTCNFIQEVFVYFLVYLDFHGVRVEN